MGYHSFATNVEVYPDEFMPLLKVINRAIMDPEQFDLTEKEYNTIVSFQDSFADLAFEYGGDVL